MATKQKTLASRAREGQTRVQEKFALYVQFAWGKRRQVLEWTRENGCAYDKVASGGRYLSIDPVTTDVNSGRSFNRYSYAENNPYYYVDLDGRSSAALVDLPEPTSAPKPIITPLVLPLPGLPIPAPVIVTPIPPPPISIPVIGVRIDRALESWNFVQLFLDFHRQFSPVMRLNSAMNALANRNKQVPDTGPPNEWVDGENRSRKYGPKGEKELDLDKPHQGDKTDHVHEWDKDGGREHPGRPYSPWPKK